MTTQFKANFDHELDKNWAWAHEEPSAWKLADGALHLRVLPGTLWGDANNAHNFLLRPLLESESGITVRVQVTNEPELMGEQGGLIWYLDDDNYIKLVKESLEGTQWIVLAREVGGEPELVNKIPFAGKTGELQLVYTDGQLQGKVRPVPEEAWEEVGSCASIAVTALAEPRIGLFTHGGPADLERWARFRDFTVIQR